MIYFTFTESENFVKRGIKLLGDEGIGELQLYLCAYPDDGTVIPASGGIRKMRWAASGRGKRGGARIIYYFAVSAERIFLLNIYAKNDKKDLTAAELKQLKQAVENWLTQINQKG